MSELFIPKPEIEQDIRDTLYMTYKEIEEDPRYGYSSRTVAKYRKRLGLTATKSKVEFIEHFTLLSAPSPTINIPLEIPTKGNSDRLRMIHLLVTGKTTRLSGEELRKKIMEVIEDIET